MSIRQPSRAGMRCRQQAERFKAVVIVVRDFGDEFAVYAKRKFAALCDKVILVPLVELEIARARFELQFLRVFAAVAVVKDDPSGVLYRMTDAAQTDAAPAQRTAK